MLSSNPTPGGNQPPPAAESSDARVRRELLDAVFEQALPAIWISSLVAVLLSLCLWNATDRQVLFTWLAVIAAMGGVRFSVVIAYRRRRDPSATIFWERVFVLSQVAVCLAWGVGGWLIMPDGSMLSQMIVYAFLIGMAGGTASLYSAHRLATVLACTGILLPATLHLALQPDVRLRIMAAGGMIFLLISGRAIFRLGRFIRSSFQLAYELDLAREAAERLARTDELTGMLNRRAFYELGHFVLEQARRSGRTATLISLDLDRFKTINDTYGHAAGDDALRALAGIMQQTCRRTDVAGRLGGDEFAILLPETTVDHALEFAERLRSLLHKTRLARCPREMSLTASIGISESGTEFSLDGLLHRADEALYDAKQQGRDRVALAAAGEQLAVPETAPAL